LYVLPDGTQAPANDGERGQVRRISDWQWVTHETLGPIWMRRDKLTEVPPSLPEEPPNGFLGVGGDDVWERDDLAEEEGEHWWRMSDPQAHTWAYVAERNPQGLIRLIQDPADDAPELPWRGNHGEIEVNTEFCAGVPDEEPIWVNFPSSWHTITQAEAVLAALSAAVREARRIQEGGGS
jgi:hypothetical protein